tara:strand:- start:322 stop:996 length:675 start_codon:yes stop_codon:yes gene_type:complete
MTRKFNNLITSFEFMNKFSIEILEKHELKIDNLKKNECYCLVEISNFQDVKDFNELIINNIDYEAIKTDDLIISKSESENKKLWSFRESIPLAEKKESFIIAHDISIPLKNIEVFVKRTTQKIKNFKKNSEVINFGHLGDNNLHFNVLIKGNEFKNKKLIQKSINRIVYDEVNYFDGSISAEHGIGQLRKKELTKHKNINEIKRMKSLKKLFDPKNILNPGKVI